jgi:hypothetical protein
MAHIWFMLVVMGISCHNVALSSVVMVTLPDSSMANRDGSAHATASTEGFGHSKYQGLDENGCLWKETFMEEVNTTAVRAIAANSAVPSCNA